LTKYLHEKYVAVLTYDRRELLRCLGKNKEAFYQRSAAARSAPYV